MQHHFSNRIHNQNTPPKYGTDGYIWLKSGLTFSRFNPYTRKIKPVFSIASSSLLPNEKFTFIFSGNDMFIGGATKFQKVENITQALPQGVNNFEKRQILLDDFFY
ncbi:MAG: hypothetical protein V9E96_09380 [Chitinophagaceae bacterium]|nr:hypothetical protein [Chitinophagaceae bacterium]MBP9739063.1 hypothetical protein [Chitinophagaceae bacterium]